MSNIVQLPESSAEHANNPGEVMRARQIIVGTAVRWLARTPEVITALEAQRQEAERTAQAQMAAPTAVHDMVEVIPTSQPDAAPAAPEMMQEEHQISDPDQLRQWVEAIHDNMGKRDN